MKEGDWFWVICFLQNPNFISGRTTITEPCSINLFKRLFRQGNVSAFEFLKNYNFVFRNRRALVITDTELKVMAAAAIIGLNRMPNIGYRTPAAIGTPMAL